MQLFSVNAAIFFKKKEKIAHETMKKTPLKVAHNRPKFFFVLPTGPKPAQISISVPYVHRVTLSVYVA